MDAALRLQALGYTDVALLTDGLAGWRDAGLELFRDVNVPSKAFGELVEARRHTPSLSAPEVQSLIEQRANIVVLDARRFDEYRTMSIPGGISVPGGELVRRARDLAPDPSTQIIVNCAGRTRSIIGAQSLINAGVPHPVAALRNGTIGWTLAGQALAHGQSLRHEDVPTGDGFEARVAAAALARRAGARRIDVAQLNDWLADERRTTYCFDVRGAAEYEVFSHENMRLAMGRAPDEYGKTNMKTVDLWTLVDDLPTKMPLERDTLQTLLGVVLREKGSNAYTDMYEGGPVHLKGEVEIESIDLRVSKDKANSRLMVLKLAGNCVRKADVLGRHHHLAITDPPRGRSLDEETSYSVERPWGKLSFGFAERSPDCLRSVVFDTY